MRLRERRYCDANIVQAQINLRTCPFLFTVVNMRDARRKILEAAREIYLEGGIDALSMRAVASRVGVTATALYRHVANKEEMLAQVIEHGLDIFSSYLSRCLAAPTPRERLEQTGAQYLRFALEHPRYYETLFMSASRLDLSEEKAGLRERRASTFQFVVDRISECMESGLLCRDDPVEVALTTWAHSHGLVALYFTGKFGDDAEGFTELYDRSRRRFLRGIAIPEPNTTQKK